MRTPAGKAPAGAGDWPQTGRARRARPDGVSVFLDHRGLGGDDLLAAVVTVSGHVVAQVDLAGGRVGRQLLGGQRVVRTALATAGRGDTGFLHSHGIAPNSVELRVLVKPRSHPPVPFQGAFARRRGRPTSFSGPPAPRTGWPPAVLPRWPTRCGRPARCPGRPGPPAGRAPARPPPGPAASACRPRAPAAARTPAAARPPAPRRGSGPGAAPPSPGTRNAPGCAGTPAAGRSPASVR